MKIVSLLRGMGKGEIDLGLSIYVEGKEKCNT